MLSIMYLEYLIKIWNQCQFGKENDDKWLNGENLEESDETQEQFPEVLRILSRKGAKLKITFFFQKINTQSILYGKPSSKK